MRRFVARPRAVFISAASIWEVAIKSELGKLSMPEGLTDELQRQGFEELVVTFADALTAGALPAHHRDPFDRMVIAQATKRDLLLVSADRHFGMYGARLLPSQPPDEIGGGGGPGSARRAASCRSSWYDGSSRTLPAYRRNGAARGGGARWRGGRAGQ